VFRNLQFVKFTQLAFQTADLTFRYLFLMVFTFDFKVLLVTLNWNFIYCRLKIPNVKYAVTHSKRFYNALKLFVFYLFFPPVLYQFLLPIAFFLLSLKHFNYLISLTI